MGIDFETIVGQIRDGVLVSDENERVQFCNLDFEQMFGYSIPEIHGRFVSEFFVPESELNSYQEMITQVSNGEIQPHYRTQRINAEGKKIVVKISISPLWQNGLLVGFMKLFRDVSEITHIEDQIQESFKKRLAMVWDLLELISHIVEIKGSYTNSHQRRTAELSRLIARDMDLPEERCTGIYIAGLLHDIGKITIPTQILTKPGALNKNERVFVESHVQAGFEILNQVDFPWPVVDVVLQHHERLDGTGYPAGLRGEEILLDARILAVADVVEAILSHRPYRPARDITYVVAHLSEYKGDLFDSDVVDSCFKFIVNEHAELLFLEILC